MWHFLGGFAAGVLYLLLCVTVMLQVEQRFQAVVRTIDEWMGDSVARSVIGVLLWPALLTAAALVTWWRALGTRAHA